MTLKGMAKPEETLRLRKMVVELHDNLNQVILYSDREIVKRLIRTNRRFTNAEAGLISSLHYNFRNPRRYRKWHGSKGRTTG